MKTYSYRSEIGKGPDILTAFRDAGDAARREEIIPKFAIIGPSKRRALFNLFEIEKALGHTVEEKRADNKIFVYGMQVLFSDLPGILVQEEDPRAK